MLKDSQRSFTYPQVNKRVNQLAHSLLSLGLSSSAFVQAINISFTASSLVMLLGLAWLTLAAAVTPVAADPLPRQWSEVTWDRLSTDTGDLEQPFGPGSEPTDGRG